MSLYLKIFYYFDKAELLSHCVNIKNKKFNSRCHCISKYFIILTKLFCYNYANMENNKFNANIKTK